MMQTELTREDRPVQQVQECVSCVLTTDDVSDLELDDSGVCRFCVRFRRQWEEHQARSEDRAAELERTLETIRRDGQGKPYDCLVGISGGVDSTYLAHFVSRAGLRPLVVHFDNGWNSELAVKNIESIVSRLKLDLRTHVVDWEEFRDLQRAYFLASVIDIEVPTDHGIYGTLFRTALDNDIQYVLGGNNLATEGFMPRGWNYLKLDHINLLDIHRQFGTRKLRTYPLFDRRLKRQARRRGVRLVEFLDLLEYTREEAVTAIETDLGWREYAMKHGESVFTNFYQGHVLPRKFGVDKRKAHLSALVCSGQITREEALRQLAVPIYQGTEADEEKQFVLKKLGFSEEEFDRIMETPPRDHRDYETEGSLFMEYRCLKPLRPMWERFRAVCGIRPRSSVTHLDLR